MDFDIYETEKLEIEIRILDKTIQRLNVSRGKFKASSIAFNELTTLSLELQKDKIDCKNVMSGTLILYKNTVSQLKIRTNILKELLSFKQDFNLKSIDEVICGLLSAYKNDLTSEYSSEIKICEMPERIKENLRNTKFNVAISESIEYKIIYTIDEIILRDDKQYLDLRDFKTHNHKNSEYFYFSPNFTLADLDDFFTLLYK